MSTSAAWSRPQKVTDIETAFGCAPGRIPPMAEIPDEFKNPNSNSKWIRLQRDWFFSGLKNVTWTPVSGVDTREAKRHLGAIQASWEPKHEHKEAAVAFLASLWFADVTYEAAK